MAISRLLLAILGAGVFPARLHGQAATEYAVKAAHGALSKIEEMHLGACRLDGAVATCIQRYYPRQFYFGVLATCFLVALFLFSKRRA